MVNTGQHLTTPLCPEIFGPDRGLEARIAVLVAVVFALHRFQVP